MHKRSFIGAMLIGLACGEASAVTATNNLAVSMTITAACTVTGGTLAFGSQGVLAANVDASTTFGVTCTNTTPYSIGLDAGAHGSSVSDRKMKGGAANTEFVNYQLFQNAGRTANWGNTVGTDVLSGQTGSGSAQTITVYGRVPAQSTGSPGAYTDTVTITVNY